MTQNKGFASLALIIIAVLVLGGGYWVWKEKAVAPVPSTPSVDTVDTTNWKTYRNDQYGFEVKYPIDLKLYEASHPTYKVVYWVPENYTPPLASEPRSPISLYFDDSFTDFDKWIESVYGFKANNWKNGSSYVQSPQTLSYLLPTASFELPDAPVIESGLSVLGFRANGKNITVSSHPYDISIMENIIATFKFIK